MTVFEFVGFALGVISIYLIFCIYNFYKIKDKCVVITYSKELGIFNRLLVLPDENPDSLYKLVKINPKRYISKYEIYNNYRKIYVQNIKIYDNEKNTRTFTDKLIHFVKN